MQPATMDFLTKRRKGNALVSLCCILLRRRIHCEFPAPSRQWHFGACLPKPLRVTARGGFIVFDCQCAMGPLQPCRRLPARLSCRQLRSAKDPAYTRTRSGHPNHVANARQHIRTAPRRPVRLTASEASNGRCAVHLWLLRVEYGCLPDEPLPISPESNLCGVVLLSGLDPPAY